MAGSLSVTPTFELQPSSKKATLQSNYLTNFDFLNQYLPDTMEKEFGRYGDRSIGSFLRNMSAEIPSNSDLIKWSEEGRLHTKYINVTSGAAITSDTATLTVADAGITACNFRIGQTVFISANASAVANRAIITAVSGLTFTVAYYEAGGQTFALGAVVTCFVYGSEFKKGANGMQGSLEAETDIFEVSPIIIKDKFAISGSDMAQIGWIEVEGDNGMGYLWYLKSKHETRLRF
jgi:hypothetical protein